MPSMPNVYSCITRWPSFHVSYRWRAFMYVDFLVQGGLNILAPLGRPGIRCPFHFRVSIEYFDR